jgi:ERCC4-related helicase
MRGKKKMKESVEKIKLEGDKLQAITSATEDGLDITSREYIIKYQNKLLVDRFGDLYEKRRTERG